jgi:uncharacterized protein (DUF1697 family)
MHGSKLKSVLEDLGFNNVQTLISSGNVLFESDSRDTTKMEKTIEQAWPAKLGFTSMTIIRSQEQLRALSTPDPYKGKPHTRETYLLVTFFKQLPSGIKKDFYDELGVNALCSIIDTTTSKTISRLANDEVL